VDFTACLELNRQRLPIILQALHAPQVTIAFLKAPNLLHVRLDHTLKQLEHRSVASALPGTGARPNRLFPTNATPDSTVPLEPALSCLPALLEPSATRAVCRQRLNARCVLPDRTATCQLSINRRDLVMLAISASEARVLPLRTDPTARLADRVRLGRTVLKAASIRYHALQERTAMTSTVRRATRVLLDSTVCMARLISVSTRVRLDSTARTARRLVSSMRVRLGHSTIRRTASL